jgi:hypothetical protein
MSRKKNTSNKQRPPKQQESVFKEAWDNMSNDINRLMPERLKGKGQKKFVLWLFIMEVVVLGVVGKFVYEWWVGK